MNMYFRTGEIQNIKRELGNTKKNGFLVDGCRKEIDKIHKEGIESS